MSSARLAFIDWMKATGMFLIVFGHVVGGPLNYLTPPIYQKQLGVAFFLFVTGFTLARETRPVRRVVVSRLFDVLLIGGVFAVVSTLASWAAGGRGQLSNYLPLLAGANVVINNFPANPTTWYIGTYIHLILLWAAGARFLRPTPALLAASLVAEVVIRATLWTSAGPFVAYMALPNWMTVWLLGTYAGRMPSPPAPSWGTTAAALAVAAPLACGLVWPFDAGFPFRAQPAAGIWSQLVASAGVSLFYAGATWLAFHVTSRLARWQPVEFLAAQTMIIFVVHMPVYYGLLQLTGSWPEWARAVPALLICYVGLAWFGAVVYRWLRPARLRERVVALVG